MIHRIKFELLRIFKIIEDKLKIIKYNSYYSIIENLKMAKINLIKAKRIYDKFLIMMLNISGIYSKFQRIKLKKFFFKWKNYFLFRKKYSELRTEIEKNSEKKFEKDLKNYELRSREKENELIELKKIMQNNNEIESGLLKSIGEFEEKENNYVKEINKIGEEKKTIQEEIDLILIENIKSQNILNNINYDLIKNKNNVIISNSENIEKNISDTFSNGNNGNSFLFQKEYLHKLEEKIREKETQIINFRKENNTNDQKINIFMMEMSQIIQEHENNS